MKRTILIGMAIPLVSLMAACSASSTTDTPTPSSVPVRSTPTAVPTSTPAATAAPTTAAAGGLSGTWSGQYSGVFNGTFTLTWTQSGSTLSGQIALSAPAETLGISGNEAGTTLTFGAVGVVTYTGSVSDNSMSGTYKTPNNSGGSWNATKAS
jgi:hypothetical protein